MNDATPPPSDNPAANPNASTLDMVRGLLRDAVEYGRDLFQLFITEFKEKSRSLLVVVGMAVTAGLFALFSFCWLSLALIGVISYGIGSWRWAFFIVGIGYGIIGLLMLIPVAHGLQGGLLSFQHTKRRLEEDSKYIKSKLAA
ncbi:MAG: phage holin family protein [Terriglobales bacterium]